MDVAKNLHYEKDGVPLNALELHDIFLQKDFKNVEVRLGLEQHIVDEKCRTIP